MQENTRRTVHLFSKVLATLLFVAGCSSARTAAPEIPFRGATLTLACPEPLVSSLKGPISGWQTRQAARVEFAPATTESADVRIVPAWQIGHLATGEKIRPLPDSLVRRDGASTWAGVLPIDRDGLLMWLAPDRVSRVPFAVPVLGEATVLVYRTDLYSDPAHALAYRTETGQDLKPPQHWAAFSAQARYFATKAKLHLPPLPADAVELERIFGEVTAGYIHRPAVEGAEGALPETALALFQDLQTGEPLLEQRGVVHALKLLQAMQASRAAVEGEPEEAFLRGRSALAIVRIPWLVRFQTDAASTVRDRFNVLPLPGAEKYVAPKEGGDQEYNTPNRMPYLGAGSVVAVLTSESKNVEAATSLLEHLLERDVSNSIVLAPAHAVRAVRGEQLEERMRWDVLGLDRERTTAAKEAVRGPLLHRGLRNPALALRLADAEVHRDLLVAQLRRALIEGADAAECLAAAAKGWRERRDTLGEKAIRDGARVSVGLLP